MKIGLLVLLGLSALYPSRCFAEDPNLYNYVTHLGPVMFNQGGGVFLPPKYCRECSPEICRRSWNLCWWIMFSTSA